MDIAVPVQLEAQCRLRGRVRTRFSEPATEAGYRWWRAERALPFVRVAMAASLVNWTLACAATFLVASEIGRFLTTVHVIANVPIVGGLLMLTYAERLRRRIIGASAFVNGVSGVVATVAAHEAGRILDGTAFADVGTVVVVLYVYFGCMILRLPPLTALPAVTPYVSLQYVYLWGAYRDDLPRLVMFGVLLFGAVVSGVWVSAALEKTLRKSFAQERQIEAQQVVIEGERQRADKLLHSILPKDIAEELKARPGTLAESHDEVTVLFADLCDFTPLAAKLSATEVVELLNDVFSRFDARCEALGVEKIKTIGDAYMAVAGVPQARPDHAEVCGRLALEMRDIVGEVAQRVGHPLAFRVGMHTGPVIAGVIGTSKFAYDLWGDTVNTAARMESHGIPGEIQVTEQVAERLAGAGYTLRERGEIEVKGKGALRTWFLDATPPSGRELAAASGADAR